MRRRKPPGTPEGGQFAEEPSDQAEISLSAIGGLPDRTRRALEDFLEFAGNGAELVARSRGAYDSDEMLRFAAEAILHRIGEAVARLPEDFTEAHPEMSWRQMKAMRNLVAHDYGAIDYNIVWNALITDLPREAAHVRRTLDDNASDG